MNESRAKYLLNRWESRINKNLTNGFLNGGWYMWTIRVYPKNHSCAWKGEEETGIVIDVFRGTKSEFVESILCPTHSALLKIAKTFDVREYVKGGNV